MPRGLMPDFIEPKLLNISLVTQLHHSVMEGYCLINLKKLIPRITLMVNRILGSYGSWKPGKVREILLLSFNALKVRGNLVSLEKVRERNGIVLISIFTL